ncbi:MAG: hypothetical protein RLZ98_138 [Pseudomonadota bacterium]|jgi:carboxymethylenebutenolidase
MTTPMDKPEITQEMIDLYDEYTHITLDRRGFLDKMTALVGSTAAAVTVTSLIEADGAAAQIVPPDDNRLVTETVKWQGATDMSGYLAKPAAASGKLPAVVVIHENRGLVPHIKDVTRRMALEGFLALGPDFLTPSGGTPEDEDKGRDMIKTLDMKATVQNSVAAVKFLKSHPAGSGKVAVIGFCWGGAMVNQTAVTAGGDLAAAVAYYGRQPKAEQVSNIQAPLMLHYAGLDKRINEGIPAYKEALEKAGKTFEIHMYEGAQHAFNNDTAKARYNKAAADLAWQRTVAFLKKHLA